MATIDEYALLALLMGRVADWPIGWRVAFLTSIMQSLDDINLELVGAIASGLLQGRAQEVSAEAYDALVGERVSGEHPG